MKYRSMILYTCCSQHQISRLQKLQIRAMQCNRFIPIQFILESLQWFSVQQRLGFNKLKIHLKIKIEAPQYFMGQLKCFGEIQQFLMDQLEYVGEI